MTSNLSQADVAKLLAEPSAVVRAELATKLAVEIDSPRLTEKELALAQDIVRTMAKDVEVTVRQSLSQSLRRAANLPHDVAVKLANDIESVAFPILESSQVLTDEDLTSIINNDASTKSLAIASRQGVSEKVSEALISHADEKTVSTLMENASARISEKGYEKAVGRFAESDTVKEKIVKRAELPVTVAERLVTLVSENLKDYLVSHHELPATLAMDIVMQSRERTVINLSAGSTEEDLAKLVAQMYHNKRLTPSIVMRALCLGDIAFFEMSMAVMADIPPINARILIHDAGRLGLKSLYVKTGMPPRYLPLARVALDVVHDTPLDGGEHDLERYRARVIERVLTQYEDFGPDDLDYLLNKLGDVLTVAA